jgi:hypothetical protein
LPKNLSDGPLNKLTVQLALDIEQAAVSRLADGHSVDVATEEPVERPPWANHVGSPVVMGRWGSTPVGKIGIEAQGVADGPLWLAGRWA